MFYELAVFLCLAVLFIVMAGTSLVSAAALWAATRSSRLLAPISRANLLFALRVLPLFLAVLFTVGFALPAFLRFEPRSSGEAMSWHLPVLAALGAVALSAIVVRALTVLRATSRAQRQWLANARLMKLEGVPLPIYCMDAPSPLLAVTGIFRPRIFVARAVAEVLSSKELSAAIAHEMAHVTALDNLKQFVLKISRPPRWLKIFSKSDAVWLNASEMAADEGALAKGASSLELSSALVKVGRMSRQVSVNSLVAASHLLPVTAESSLAMRVTHLQDLLENDRQPIARRSTGGAFWIGSFAAVALAYLVCMNAILPWMHEALEFLVR
jgi:Zn-dependent protease with chaperone function